VEEQVAGVGSRSIDRVSRFAAMIPLLACSNLPFLRLGFSYRAVTEIRQAAKVWDEITEGD
jgi:hypothetical protein